MNNRSPTLQFMVACSMENVRRSDRNSGTGRFYRGKGGVIVHHVVVQQDFLPSSPPHVKRGKIIERACRARAGKEPHVCSIPKTVFPRLRHLNRRRILFRSRSRRHLLRVNSRNTEKTNISAEDKDVRDRK